MQIGSDNQLIEQGRTPSSYGRNRPLLATKFSQRKEISQLLADIIYQRAVVIKVLGAGSPTTTQVSAMLGFVCDCQVDDFALLPFRRRMYIALFMDADRQEELSEKAFHQASYTFKTTKLTFEPFKMNLHSTINPLRQRVILAMEGVPPELWNKPAITDLLDNCCVVEELYGEHHINDLSVFKLAAWTTSCDLIPKVIDWGIQTDKEQEEESPNYDWEHNQASSVILVHLEKLFDYSYKKNENPKNEATPPLPIIKTFHWVSYHIDSNHGPTEGGSPLEAADHLAV